MSSNCTIAVCQFTATNNKENNLNSVKKLVCQAVENGAKMVFLPEASDYIGTNKDESRNNAETLSGTLMTQYRQLARTNKIWLSIGGFHEKINEDTIYNSHILIDVNGEIQSIYRKIHLFDVTIPDKNINLRESDVNEPGSQICGPVSTPAGHLGLGICYDLRFPELGLIQRKLGADILTYPSAFTNATGKVHWEALLRARAIENQCYVIAAAQYGIHNEKRTSYGQAMVIDPWGKIIAECPKYTEPHETNESIALADIDLDLVKKIREEMPVMGHRRDDIYKLELSDTLPKTIDVNKDYSFADKVIPGSTVFYESKYCFAFTNIRCVVPGHVLVSTLRVVKRLEELSSAEVTDLFQTVVKLEKLMETVHSTNSTTICCQDGPLAGQTVPHVHVHILPRKEGDFSRNNDIYDSLAKHDQEDNPNPLRDIKERSEEAKNLRSFLYK